MIILRDPVTAFVALGANLGDATQSVLKAFDALSALPGIQLTGRSYLYGTSPHEAQGPDFVNAVARIETRLTAPELLNALQDMETRAGRLRSYVNAPRTLDLDVLFYGDAKISSPRLTVPHPRWQDRAFVLYPLADVRPDRVSDKDLARVATQGVRRLIG